MSVNNPYGIVTDTEYNYFSHIRYVLFKGQTISTSKSITQEEYMRSYTSILAYREGARRSFVDLQKKVRSNTFSGVLDKVKLDNLAIELRAMPLEMWHSAVLAVFTFTGKDSISFDKLIEMCMEYGVVNGFYGSLQARNHALRLKNTFNSYFLQSSYSAG